jgi:hypothetical protein
MSKEFSEPEEKNLNVENAQIIDDDFNPLGEPVLEKEYTKHNVRIDPKEFSSDIPEPKFTPPPMGGTLKQEEKTKKPEPQEPINKEFNRMSNKDKEDAAGKFAEMMMTGYKALNGFVDSKLLFDEKKINKLAREGEIDLSMQVPISHNQTMSVSQFIEEYNEQTRGTIKVSKEFEEETMPVLTRVLAKRGVGFSDEQYLGYLVIKDGLSKAFLVSQSISVKKEFLQMFKDGMQTRNAQFTPPPMTTPQPEPQPQYTPPPKPQRNPDTNVNDFVNQMTGSFTNEEAYTMDESYEQQEEQVEQQSNVVVISDVPTKPKGSRGRPKKK